MMILCPRCLGQMRSNDGLEGKFWTCFQCGHEFANGELKDTGAPPTAPKMGYTHNPLYNRGNIYQRE